MHLIAEDPAQRTGDAEPVCRPAAPIVEPAYPGLDILSVEGAREVQRQAQGDDGK